MMDSGWTRTAAVLLAATLVACGDPATTDDRGYTKAPLEDPGATIRGEEPGEMSRYGDPNRVAASEIELPEAAESVTPTDTGPATQVALPEGVTQAMVDAGQQIFSGPGTCFVCHGQGGAGSPLAPALNDAEWLNIDGSYEAIVGIATNGVPTPKQFPAPMLPRGGSAITDEQVREVAAYVYSISR